MDKFYMNEGYDFISDEEILAKKKKKKFLISLFSSIFVFILIIGIILGFVYKKINNRVYEMVPVNQEVSLSNGNIGKERAKVVEYQKLIMQKKNYLLGFTEYEYTNDLIRNGTYVVFDDGTYYENVTETFKGKYSERFQMGNISIDKIKEYITENKEKLIALEDAEIEDDHSPFDNGCVLINVDGNFKKLFYDQDDEYISEFIRLYQFEDKELVQNFKINNDK